jgi:protein O-GlcNAc transferase
MPAADRANAGGSPMSQRLIEEGHRLEDSGDVAGALAQYEAAVAASPAYLRGYLNLGNALQRLGRTVDAVAALDAALRLDPTFAAAHFNLGNVHAAAGDLSSAEAALRSALALEPTLIDASVALANVLEQQRRPREAEALLRGVLLTAPGCAAAAYNLALLLQERSEIDEAERLLRECLAVDPAFLPACTALGNLLRNAGQSRDAEPWYRRAMTANPADHEAHSALLLSLNNRDDLDAQVIFAEHMRFGAAFPEDAPTRAARKALLRRHARIRVGFLSGDFVQHAVALFMRPLLEHIDRLQFEVFCYSNNRTEDWMTEEIRSRAEHWRNIAGRDDALAAHDIGADELDVLVDLSGHAARSRVLLFNRGCAPVQATWLGYLNTTGLGAADFRITDERADPAGVAERFHVERLQRLPDCQWCYAPVLDLPRQPVPPRDSAEAVVFGSFNHQSKIGERCVTLWSRVLRAVPASTLRIYNAWPSRATSALRQRFEEQGVEGHRISTHAGLNIDRYFAAIGDVDIALDSFPYNGGTTTFDILWMEVPLVALAGERSVARSGVSILGTLGMPELIATSDDEYVDINCRLAADAGWRRRLRESLRARMQASPLMDATRFARGFEDAIRRMLDESRRT